MSNLSLTNAGLFSLTVIGLLVFLVMVSVGIVTQSIEASCADSGEAVINGTKYKCHAPEKEAENKILA